MSNGNSGGGAEIALAMFGLLALSASSGATAYFLTIKEDDEKPTSTLTSQTTPDKVVGSDAITPANCSGETKIQKKSCHNPETGDVFDGTPGKCGPGKELWIPDPSAPGYVAATGDGTCEGELRDCSVDCPTPCSGGEWKQDPSDYCKVITYDNSNPPQKVETRLNGTTACGTGVVSEILDETRGNFVEAKGLGSCTKERVGACEVTCPAGMPSSSGCSYYANRQLSANGCMKVDANGNALEYKPDKSNNVACGESGKQEYFYLPIISSTCGRLSDWEPCSGPPCPIDCVGNWRQATPSNPEGWEACVGNCGQQPQKRREYQITREAQHGGAACPHADGFAEYTNCGSITPCCGVGAWQDGTCASNGFMTRTRVLTENGPNGCANVDDTQTAACCYQAGDWKNIANEYCSNGKIKMKQTIAGNCPADTEFQVQDCNSCEGYFMKNNKQWCEWGGDKYGLRTYYKFTKTKDASANNPDKVSCTLPSGDSYDSRTGNIAYLCSKTCTNYPASEKDHIIHQNGAIGCASGNYVDGLCDTSVTKLNNAGWTSSNPKWYTSFNSDSCGWEGITQEQ